MRQPEGFIAKGYENKVCRLVKSLYGLKQAPKQWHKRNLTVPSMLVSGLHFGFRMNVMIDKRVSWQ